MKKIILIFIFFLCAKSFAQTNGITYQALILNPTEGKVSTAANTNSPLVSKDICMLFKFVDEFSNVEYQEVIRTKTDPYGMVNLIIGTGTQTAGYSTSFDKISWDSVQKNLVVGISFTGDCSSFTEISNQPFSSVPFAYSSINAVNVTGVVALENGGTNATTVLGAKTNLELENVDNTSDLNKPISTASKLALNLKEDIINKSTNVTTDGNSDIKYPTVKSVKNYVDSSVSFNLSGLTNEISRATTAENTIAANLVLETERATLAETNNATAINLETNRASLAENTLTTNLTAEVNRATTAEATKEDTANKSTDGLFTSNSDVKFPTEKATKTYVDASASSNSLALINEISRATLVENTIAANLVLETERATLTEASNATAITTETNRATLAENTLSTDLTAEVNRATIAEATKEDAANKSTDGSFASNSDVKFPTEKATKTYVDASVSTNSMALNNEISRATLAENTIAANLVSETERATLAETNNATAITSETNRASLAEATLTTNLTAEVNRATTAEATKEDTINKSTDGSFTSNSDVKFPTEKATKTYVDASASSTSLALNNEISRATTAENTIAANLVSETERATLAEASNTTAITTETNRATLAETTLTTNFTAEVNRATTAEATKEDTINKSTDGSFTSNSDVKFPTEKATKTYVDVSASSNSLALTNEISRATTAENTIAANLITETERATLAETNNATTITAETNRASLAEATLTTNLTAEVNRATIAEATKEDAANKSADGTFTSNSDVKFPTEKATKTYVDASSFSNSLALTNEISRATLAENTIASNLDTETERATLAEATNATAITTETNRATLAETTLTTNFTAEVNRATTAEATKEDSVNKSTDGSFTSNSDLKFPTEKATKTYVDASASSNSLALTNEISRATTAENTIAANLVSETERATLAETNNATAITAEITRATLAEASNATEITAEVNRAIAAEATKEDTANKSTDGSFTSNSDVKFPTEKATKTYVDASASSNSLALTNEISRATTAENTIAANLVSETERATLAETNNATAITAEITRATLAEATNSTAISAETTRSTLAETNLAANLTAEVNRATSAEATKEDAANKSTDGSFASNSDVKFPTEKATKTYVDASASSNSLALTNEISRATTAENAIATNLVLETERATLAETNNTTAITAETTRATLAETTLTTNLTAETNRATLAENTLTTNLTAETNRATTAEATKEDAANKSTDGSFATNSDVKFPTEKATKTYVDASASSNSVALTNEISRATLAENAIAANLISETERATLAEATNATAINAETNRATLAETNNTTAITAEINRATLAETTLTTNLTAEVNRATTAEATKEDAANKSTDGSFTSNSDVKFPTEKATKTYVDASASSNSLALTNEISRATLAENTIAANLVLETERATLAEATNATAINAETNRATLAETNNTTAITAEINRATLAETTLTTNLTAELNRATASEATKEDTINKSTDGSFASNSDVKFPTEKATKTYVDASASSNSLALTNEISRATLAENTIAANLVLETERATLAEATNATALTTETTRATSAESNLTTNLNAEVNRATTAEATKEDTANKSTDGSFTSNSDVKFPTEKATKTYVDASASSNSLALTNEISRATLAENIIAANLVLETERATLAETSNATAITSETTRATLAEATKEDAANKSIDGSFTSNSDVKFPTEKATKTYVNASASSSSLALTNEISRATLVENTIAANLVLETERATLAENTIAANLVFETERATLAEAINATAINAETNRATLAETTLSTNLITEVNRATIAEATKEDAANKSTDGSFASNSDVKFPTEKATKTYVDASASSNSLALNNEISRATLAETNNATAITAETTRATLAEATLTTNLTAEVNRATTAEATKEDTANKSTDGSFTSNSDVKFPTEKATKTYVDASASSNSLALTNEISRATLAENAIAANLVTETERATLAEATNATALTTETNRATLAETTLSTNLNAETNRATLAETTLTTNLTAELNRATASEATKEDTINKSTDGSFASNSDVKFPTEKATKTYVDASSSSNSLALTNEISRATLAENTLATNLDLKANLASPNFTGTPSLPTETIAVTQSAENNSTAIATTAFVTAANATNANLTGDVTSIGNLTTIATNVITTTKIADSNITNAKLDKANIPLSGFGVAASDVALGNNKLTEVADPTNPQDAATKNYVDALTSIGVTGNGTTNYIPKFSSSRALANSLIFDSGTQIGIGTNAPTSLFQIGGNGSGDNPLKYDYDGGGNGALKFGFRQYEYRIKSNQNSGVLENLTFSYYNQSTGVDSDRFVIANDGIYIPGKLDVTGTVNGGAATLSSLNVNNSQLNVNSSTNTVGFFTDSPTSKFQIGGDGNFDNPLKYDYGYGSGEGALKFGFRQNEFRIKTNQNSGVLEKLTFSYYKNADGTDIESMHIDNNGVVSITKLAVTAGSPGNGKVLTSDAFGNASWVAPVVASSNEFVDLTTTQTIAGAKTFSSTVTGNSFVKSGGTSAQYLMADGTVSTGAAPVREVADETSAAASQNSFTLTQTPSINSKVKMYVNGIRISNAAYSVSGTTLTYIPANNGSYILSVNDRVQFDYFY